MHGVRDERGGLAGEAEVRAEALGEGLGGERREEVPLDVVVQVVRAELDVDLGGVLGCTWWGGAGGGLPRG